jgi:DNA-binding CsgD family transcriptional regulator
MLLGRETELARIAGNLDRVLTSDGGALVLRGEAGAGKSALLTAAAEGASNRGIRVLATTGVQAEVDLPYAGLHRLLRVDVGGGEPFQVARAVLDVVTTAAAEQPLALVVDDAHWLDRPSWDALTFVGRRLEADPITLLMGVRDESDSDRRLAMASLPELAVGPLAEAAAARLLDLTAPNLAQLLRDRVLAEAMGNPLAVVEFGLAAARYGEAALLPSWLPLSTRVEQGFVAMVAELPELTRALLLVAALDDGDGLAEILSAGTILADTFVSEDNLRPAITAGLVRIDDGMAVRFRHPLLRSALRQSAPDGRRRTVHAALAGVMAEQPDRAVWHRAAAAMRADEALASELTDMAYRARRRGALTTTVFALERAAQLSEHPHQRTRRMLWATRFSADIGDVDSVVRLLREVEGQELSPAEQAHLSWLREAFMTTGWSGAAKVGAYVDLVDQMRHGGEDELALDSLVNVSVRFWWTNLDDATRARVVEAVDRLDVAVDDIRRIFVRGVVAPIERGADTLAALRGHVATLDPDPESQYLAGTVANTVGDYPMAAVFHAAGVAGLRGQGRLGLLGEALNGQAWNAAQLGDTRLGLTAAAEARALLAEGGQHRYALIAELVRGAVEALRGNGAAALEVANTGEGLLLGSGAHTMLGIVQWIRGLEATAGGRYAEAFEQLRRVFDRSDIAYHAFLRYHLLGPLIEAAVHCGQHAYGRTVLSELSPAAEESRSPVLRMTVAYTRAVLAVDDAEPLFQEALAVDLGPWAYERARISLAYGIWLRRQRRAADCRAQLRAAAEAYDALGVAPWAERARQELRASGETLRRREDAGSTLTPQELQIARLAADGLSNRDIAERLFLSQRTVTTHLSRIYPKLGVSSRAEVAGALDS